MKTVVRKNPLGLSWRVFIILGIAVVILVPLIPLGVRSAWVYTSTPEFCVSCHMMTTQYSNWSHSAHRNWATCSDCHLPQQSLTLKVAAKVREGIYHGYAYMLDKDATSIRISRLGGKSVMSNCIRCHGELVQGVHKDNRNCWQCHIGLAHGY
ncbi:MAG: NapC/NirT family cytochrome c [Nitrospirae bacterium]|uniref:cytochrome c3 family protein n=1 Tax=Candidatus Magnetobacterium casense TaxID=1455061 RepID=UPI0006991BA6|nr:NapC/NirT family cytochrome c [Candidatus Magnetobacterium casensis]MBF0336818.1 NapC/NirT family cytochrome c [Nitrospirota bacterium]